MRYFIIVFLLLPSFVAAQGYLPQFSTVQDAAEHCPGDTVVYVDATKASFRYSGAPKSVNTGGYICRQEAIGSGWGGLVTHLQPVSNATPSAQQPQTR